jgi:copper(I)-binding protein
MPTGVGDIRDSKLASKISAATARPTASWTRTDPKCVPLHAPQPWVGYMYIMSSRSGAAYHLINFKSDFIPTSVSIAMREESNQERLWKKEPPPLTIESHHGVNAKRGVLHIMYLPRKAFLMTNLTKNANTRLAVPPGQYFLEPLSMAILPHHGGSNSLRPTSRGSPGIRHI